MTRGHPTKDCCFPRVLFREERSAKTSRQVAERVSLTVFIMRGRESLFASIRSSLTATGNSLQT
jgi:hypothetical protein